MTRMSQRVAALFIPVLAIAVAVALPSDAQAQACPSGPLVLDFDVDDDGRAIEAGEDLSSAYSGFGIDIVVWNTQNMSSYGLPIAFDSSNPTGGDWDLGTPNSDFGGPGNGSGGGLGQPGENNTALGNLMISAENFVDADGDGLIDVPDDDANGAWFELFFDEPTCVFGATTVDVEAGEGGADIIHYDPSGSTLLWVDVDGVGNNGVEVVEYEICGVDHVMYDIYSSGAFDNLRVCVGGEEEVCDGIDNDGDGDVDEDSDDLDGDGYADCVDCDDNDASVTVGSEEVCDGIDNDCDGEVDEPLYDTTSAVNDPAVRPAAASHSITLPGISTEFSFDPPGVFLEDEANGTATLTGTVWNDLDPSEGFDVAVSFSARNDGTPSGSPHTSLLASAYASNGGPIDPDTWHYYEAFSGTLTGVGDLAGASIDIVRYGPSYQVGVGANGKNTNFGSSGWLTYNVTAQPSSGPALQSSGQGDINVDHEPNCDEECDGLDNDGDGLIDEDSDDLDGDGYADCVDCDDNDANVNAGADEVCDGVDNDCDGLVDEGLWDATRALPSAYSGAPALHALWMPGIGTDFVFDPAGTFVEDEDAGTATLSGHVESTSSPGNGFDVEVTFSGRTDVAGAGSPKMELYASAYAANGGPVDPSTWWYYTSWGGTLTGTGNFAGASVDLVRTGPAYQVGDGANGKNASFGSSGWMLWTVTAQPASGSLTATGQGDFNLNHASACGEEVCDGLDNDLDGDVDEGFDVDGDGYTSCDGDCDDDDAAINPDASEVCNGVDDDCDGVVPADETDDDGDGVTECDGDCDDADGDNSPGNTEICDGQDNDCDGAVDEGFDNDGDGWTTCAGDCDDNNPGANPDCPDICNGIDDNCDGEIDEDFDQDGDGVTTCDGDCDDDDPEIYPGAVELCDNIDNDCDGNVDEESDNDSDGIPDCIDECPMIVDFDEDPWGNELGVGDDATTSYGNWGITVERYADAALEIALPANIADLGPGHDGGMAAPDNANTWWLVTFTSSTCVHSIDILGAAPDELAPQVILFDVNVQTITTVTAASPGDSSSQTLDLGGVCGVYVMMVDFYADGGWDNLNVCVDPTGTEEVCGDGEDNDGDGDVDEDCPAAGDDDDDDAADDDDDDDDDDAADDDDDDDDDDDEEPDWDCSMAGDRVGGGMSLFLLAGLGLGVIRRRRA